jgi:hypothetical protein
MGKGAYPVVGCLSGQRLFLTSGCLEFRAVCQLTYGGGAARHWVEKHVCSILAKLRLPETDDDHRRVLAVVTFLESR